MSVPTVGLRDEVTELLQALIRLDTVNPPGNETVAAELLRSHLGGHGISCELVARAPDRANLIARLPGGDGPSLAFLCHTDTVVADAADWARDPWSGDLVDGEVWGRGALDMKGQVAAGAVALASLAREGFSPAGDLLFVATADEEVGEDSYGLQWLVDQHPELVRVDFAINEGGGERIELAGRPYYVCATAEKMSAPFRLRVRGRAGHASAPGIADNALVKAARCIEAIAAFQPPVELIPEVRRFLEVTLGELPPAEDAVTRAHADLGPVAAELIEPLIRAALGEGDWTIEWIEEWGGTRSGLDTPLWSALEEFVAGLEPAAALVPTCCAGFTDSHWLRAGFDTVAYGFFPMRAMDVELAARLVHSADERAAVDDLELGVEALRHVATSLV